MGHYMQVLAGGPAPPTYIMHSGWGYVNIELEVFFSTPQCKHGIYILQGIVPSCLIVVVVNYLCNNNACLGYGRKQSSLVSLN